MRQWLRGVSLVFVPRFDSLLGSLALFLCSCFRLFPPLAYRPTGLGLVCSSCDNVPVRTDTKSVASGQCVRERRMERKLAAKWPHQLSSAMITTGLETSQSPSPSQGDQCHRNASCLHFPALSSPRPMHHTHNEALLLAPLDRLPLLLVDLLGAPSRRPRRTGRCRTPNSASTAQLLIVVIHNLAHGRGGRRSNGGFRFGRSGRGWRRRG